MIPRSLLCLARLALLAAACGAGCRRAEMRVYTAPKDPAKPSAEAAEASASRAERPRPKITYTRPEGWKEATPSEVSLADFTVTGEGGEASVNVTPLPNLEGKEAMVVNMYRQKAGLPPLEQNALEGVFKPVEVAGGQGQLLEVSGQPEGQKPLLIVTAIAHRDGRSWFFRMAGDPPVVEAQKPAFLDFLKSVHIVEASEPAATSGPEKMTAFNWTVPAAWKTVPPGQMQVAKFSVPPAGEGAGADVSVSVFPGDTGGTLANVNRWRKQLGLPEVDEAGMAPSVTPLEGGPPASIVVSLAAGERALVGAIVPRQGRWWFYKLLGAAPAVAAQREAFLDFAKSEP